jgi:hypothetical protein
MMTYAAAETPKYNDGTFYEDWVMAICWICYGYIMFPVFWWFFIYAFAVYRKTGFTRVNRP